MKNIVLATMTVLTLAGPVSAEVSAWDYFWGTTVSQGLNPKTNGWDNFWGQCQDTNKSAGDCVGTIAAGIGMVVAAPVIAVAAVAGVAIVPVTTTVTVFSVPFIGLGGVQLDNTITAMDASK